MNTAQPSLYRAQVLEELDRIPQEYLPALANLVRAFRESFTMPSAEESFRQGWLEARRGETRPITEDSGTASVKSEPDGSESIIEVRFTPEFKRNLRRLARKYRRIKADLEPLVTEIKAGGLPGAQIPRVGAEVYKARLANSDLQRGKSGGYRVIYSVETQTLRVLVTIYSKTQQADVSLVDLRRLINELDTEA